MRGLTWCSSCQGGCRLAVPNGASCADGRPVGRRSHHTLRVGYDACREQCIPDPAVRELRRLRKSTTGDLPALPSLAVWFLLLSCILALPKDPAPSLIEGGQR